MSKRPTSKVGLGATRRDIVTTLGAAALAIMAARPALARRPDGVDAVKGLDDLARRAPGDRPVWLDDAGRDGLFRWTGDDVSRSVTHDPARGLNIPPTRDPSGKSGAWVRVVDGRWRPEWFGAVGDGETDDTAAMVGMATLARHDGRLQAQFTRGKIYAYQKPAFLSGIIEIDIEGNGAGVRNIAGSSVDKTFFSNYQALEFTSIFQTNGPNLYEGSKTPYDLGVLIRSARRGQTRIELIERHPALVPGAPALLYGFDGLSNPGGFPPCPRYFEYVDVVDVRGNSISLAKPLVHDYDERWPDSPYKAVPVGRPKILPAARGNFRQTERLRLVDLALLRNPRWTAAGGTVERNGRLTLQGYRKAQIERLVVDGTVYVGQGEEITMTDCHFKQTVESDKALLSATFQRVRMHKHILGNGTRNLSFEDCDIEDTFVANPIDTLTVRGGRIRGEGGGSAAMFGFYGGVRRVVISGTTVVTKGRPKGALLGLVERAVVVSRLEGDRLIMTLAEYDKSQICRALFVGATLFDKDGTAAFRVERLPVQEGDSVVMTGAALTAIDPGIKPGDKLHLSFLNDVEISGVRLSGEQTDGMTTLGDGAPNSLAGFTLVDEDRGGNAWRLDSRRHRIDAEPRYMNLTKAVRPEAIEVTVATAGAANARLVLRPHNGPVFAEIDLSRAGTRTLSAGAAAQNGDRLMAWPERLRVLRYQVVGASGGATPAVRLELRAAGQANRQTRRRR